MDYNLLAVLEKWHDKCQFHHCLVFQNPGDISCLGSNDLFHSTKTLRTITRLIWLAFFLLRMEQTTSSGPGGGAYFGFCSLAVGMRDQLDLQYNLLVLLVLVEDKKDHQASCYNLLQKLVV